MIKLHFIKINGKILISQGFHSKIKFEEAKVAMACGIPLLPIKTTVAGPAAALPAGHKDNDIID